MQQPSCRVHSQLLVKKVIAMTPRAVRERSAVAGIPVDLTKRRTVIDVQADAATGRNRAVPVVPNSLTSAGASSSTGYEYRWIVWRRRVLVEAHFT